MLKGSLGKAISILAILVCVEATWAQPEVVPNEYVVQLREGVKLNSNNSIFAQSLAIKIQRKIPNTNIIVVKSKEGIDSRVLMSQLKQNDSVILVEPNYIYRINRTPNDPELGKLWGLINNGQDDSNKIAGTPGVDIGAEKAWDIQTGNKDLVIAVIDTGIDYTHPDLKENVWVNFPEFNGKPGVDDDGNGFVDDIHGYDFVNQDGDPMDDHGHGSHCSGTIGAKGDDFYGITGVAWNTRIMGLKFLSKEGSGSLDAAVEAIKYATKMGAKIMSNSWGGGGYSEILKNAIQEASDKGIVFTAAAGNHSNNNDDTPSYPANYEVPNVISVAAVDNKGSLAYFSCFGKKTVHVAAPGVNVYSSIPGGYDSWSGTSMATPHVTGVVALLLSNEPKLSPFEVRDRLIRTSKPLSGLRGKVASNGLIDAYYTLTDQQAPPDLNDPDNWKNSFSLSISTSHPYSKNTSQTWEIEVPGASELALYFEKFNTENRYDKITIYDRQGKKLGEMTGDKGVAVWSQIFAGDYLLVTFSSDDSVQKYGFDLTKVAYR